MFKKYIGLCLSFLLFTALIVQITSVYAQQADEPITGPITQPITSPSDTPTDTPTPTLIETVSTTPTETPLLTDTPTPTETPIPTDTPTPSITAEPTITPTESPTPTPTPTIVLGIRLGGLNLDGYCSSLNLPWDVVLNNAWYCGNGSSAIDMTKACQWQYNITDVTAQEDIPNNIYSWTCYTINGVTPSPTPTPSMEVSPTETPIPTETPVLTPTPTETPIPTDTPTPPIITEPTATPTETPSTEVSPTATPSLTQTPEKHFYRTFLHFPFGFPFTVNAVEFFHQGNIKQRDIHMKLIQSCANNENSKHEKYYHSS